MPAPPSGVDTGPRLGSSSHAASEGFRTTKKNNVDSHIMVDLQRHEQCDIEKALGVFLARCYEYPAKNLTRPDPSTPKIPQTATVASSNWSPESDTTEKAEAVSDSASVVPDPNPTEIDHAPFDECLEAMIHLCTDAELQRLLSAYCLIPGKEQVRYTPLARAVNYALEKLGMVKVRGVRPPSDSNILFQVNDKDIVGIGGSVRKPDLALVSLHSARHIHQENADEDDDVKWRRLAYGPCLQSPAKHQLRWWDVLASCELKREYTPIGWTPQKGYGYSLKLTVPPLDLEGWRGYNSASASASTTDSASAIDSTSTNSPISNTSGSLESTLATDKPFGPTGSSHAQTSASGIRHRVATPSRTQGTKRQRDAVSQESGEACKANQQKRTKNHDVKQAKQQAIAQSGTYATEMLGSSLGRRHAIGLVIVDACAWVWWFDRQSAIQFSGINIVEDLPRFLLLLFTFQRFSLADWGYDTELDPRVARHNPKGQAQTTEPSNVVKLDFSPELEVSIDPTKVLYEGYSLVSRATRVIEACSNSPDVAGIPLVAKISWPNKARLDEKTIIERAVEGAKAAEDHLPRVFASRDGHDTEDIRWELGIHNNSPRPPRVLRIIIFERLEPITSLEGPLFVIAWVHCVRCHYLVWKSGIHHRDLSVRNLMVRKQLDQYLGVVNDWDLSFVETESHEEAERTATIPFLALDLLVPEYWAGTMKVEYRHDLESFVWIIFWIFECQGNEGNVPADLVEWQTSDYKSCLAKKTLFLRIFLKRMAPLLPPIWKAGWPLVHKVLVRLVKETAHSMAGETDDVKKPMEEVGKEFMKLIQYAWSLETPFPCIPPVDDFDRVAGVGEQGE